MTVVSSLVRKLIFFVSCWTGLSIFWINTQVRRRIPYRSYKTAIKRIVPASRSSTSRIYKKTATPPHRSVKPVTKKRDSENFASYSHTILGFIRNSPNKLIKTSPRNERAFLTNRFGQKLPVIITHQKPTGPSNLHEEEFYLGSFFNPDSRKIEYAFLDNNSSKKE